MGKSTLLGLLGDLSIYLFDVVTGVVNLEIHSLFILHRVKTRETALHMAPEPLAVHEVAEQNNQAQETQELVDHEHKHERTIRKVANGNSLDKHWQSKERRHQ